MTPTGGQRGGGVCEAFTRSEKMPLGLERKSQQLTCFKIASTPLHGYSRPLCILLCSQQCSAPAVVWEGTQRGQLSGPVHIPGSSLHPETSPGMPRSQDDPATDLSHAEDDEAGQEQRGCRRRCQEAGVSSSSPGVARHQVGEEMRSKLSQTQT